MAEGPFEKTHTVLARSLINSNYFQSETSKDNCTQIFWWLETSRVHHLHNCSANQTELDIDI